MGSNTPPENRKTKCGFLAQKLPAFEAAKLGVYLHGLVAEIVSEKTGLHSMLARDLCENLGKGFNDLVGNNENN